MAYFDNQKRCIKKLLVNLYESKGVKKNNASLLKNINVPYNFGQKLTKNDSYPYMQIKNQQIVLNTRNLVVKPHNFQSFWLDM